MNVDASRPLAMWPFSVALNLLVVILLVGCGSVESEPGNEPMEPGGGAMGRTVVAENSFVPKAHGTGGGYQIQRSEKSGDLRLVLDEDFTTSEGPDLFVVLSPKGIDEVNSENVLEGEAVIVDSLQSASGRQIYDLDDGLELDIFNSVGIHCVQYEALFAAATLD